MLTIKSNEIKKDYVQCGCSPLDLKFTVEGVAIDDLNHRKYIYIISDPDGNEYGVRDASVFGKPHITSKEIYENLEEAKQSRYYLIFVKLDSIINKYIKDIYHKLDDTKYSGIRCGSYLTPKGLRYFVESCSHINGTAKYNYIQIQSINGKYHYSITNKSIFLRMQLGDMYNLYYDNKEDIQYLVDSDNYDDLASVEHTPKAVELDIKILKRFINGIENKKCLLMLDKRHIDDNGK